MTSIVRYRKHITAYTIIELHQPESESGDRLTTELATLGDGFTYVAVPEGVVLPVQPDEIRPEEVVLTDELREQIKHESPHVRLINKRIVEKIRQRYTADDERKYAADTINSAVYGEQLSQSQETKRAAYMQYRNECVAWGKAQKAALGL
ncbi:hypothetical protein [Endozoicomonas sp. GU-1]|uniref:hypothetical protein n=1 Tax=Endozoicomonas sp. GU-1 TaxID=3009078 RepID=UPI0022B5DF67|nr:hypothetical protein [Endozoicomonas sp. GU-1]WBA79544.1 hypothetical protein O2T12_14265 [Endozoicomonas sp. GU-1]